MDDKQPLEFSDINHVILRTLQAPGRFYWVVVSLLFLFVLFAGGVWSYQLRYGLGVAGYRPSVMWGAYLVNFVFWIGIAHSGTLISAILYLFRARWRTGISRAAEAMTIFAVMIAGLFPAFIHLGRPWVFYWIIPYPNQRFLWPDFQSPLIFDVLAVTTYFVVSLLFWYTGLVPDLAAVRDRTEGIRKKMYGFVSLGWSGTDRQWQHYGTSYLLLAGLATPLVISVHSVVSWDFALAIIPGYHSTIFPPYFVAGAIHSGLAMVLTLLVPLRKIFRFEKIITLDILEMVAKTNILMALIVGYAYVIESFIAWYSGSIFERQTFLYRIIGYYAPLFWLMCVCNAIAPLAFFWKKVRRNTTWLFVISVLINIGMWTERFVIICGSMSQDFLPHAWGFYWPNWVEIIITAASFALFLLLFLLFAKFLPSVAIAEVKGESGAPIRGGGRYAG
jgi:molybdopterin-containing oxidoreductase family membrane subunit